MADTTLTHSDLAAAVGVSVTSIKSYRRKFPGFIPVASWGKPIRFTPEALDVCRKIRDCFDQGMSVSETEKKLREAGFEPDDAARSQLRPGQAPPDMERFMETAGQMMHDLSRLASAQTRTEERLTRLERMIGKLTEVVSAAPAARPEPASVVSGSEPKSEPTPTPPPAEPEPPAAKILDRFLVLPVALRTDTGEFIGLPGRMDLAGLAKVLERDAALRGNVAIGWQTAEQGFGMDLKVTNGEALSLRFVQAVSPNGVDLAELVGIERDGVAGTSADLLVLFRKVKGLVAEG